MRKSLFLLLPFATTLGLYACESESGSSSSGNVPPFEAGAVDQFTTPPTDAPVTPDAPNDVQADTTPLPQTVTVFVTKLDGTAQASVDVIFSDASGATLSATKTGADGKVTSSGALPATATALFTVGGDTEALTWTALQAGDELRASAPIDPNTGVGAYNLGFNGGAPNGTNYYANVGVCYGQRNDTDGAITVGLVQQCVRPGATNAALVLGTTSPSFIATHAAFVKNVAHPNNAVVNATLGAFVARTNVTVSATNRPAQGFLRVQLTEVAGTMPFPGDVTFPTNEPSNAFVTPGFADGIQTYATVQSADSLMTLGKRWAPTTTAFAIDFAQLPPRVTGGAVDNTNGKRPKVSWSTSAALAGFDGGAVRVSWSTPDEASHGWTVLVPPSSTSTQLPDLPAASSKWAPVQGVEPFPVVGFVDVDSVPNEATFRREAGRLLPVRLGSGIGRDLVLPATNATYRATEWQPNFD